MMSDTRPRSTLFIIVIAMFLFAACNNAAPAPTTAAPDKISIQLSWIHEYSVAPFYAAEKNGHFKAQNLDVTLIEGGFKDGKYIEPIDEVLNGTVTFGMSSAPILLLARADGKAVTGIATILQRSPLSVISLAKSNIRRPQDLVGKKVLVAEGGSTQVYNSLLASQGIDPTKVNTQPRTTFGVEPLLKGEADALVGWIINEGVQVREAGQEPSFLLMSDYGVDSYDFVVFTSEKMLKEKPDVVERLTRAVIAGIRDVIGAPDKAVDHVLAYGNKLERKAQADRLQASIPLINTSGSKPGVMSDTSWEIAYKILLDQKALKAQFDYKTAYTLAVTDKIYAQ
jgi:NitT/TauT family transport system substrate-binding protein